MSDINVDHNLQPDNISMLIQSRFAIWVSFCPVVYFKDMRPPSAQNTVMPLVALYLFYSHNYPFYLVVHQNTLKQLESHILMPPYTNSVSRPMATKCVVLPPSL